MGQCCSSETCRSSESQMNHASRALEEIYAAYRPSYLDIDAALSRYYHLHGQEYKHQFAIFCEENRCTERLEELLISGGLAYFDCDIPFATEPTDKYLATAALLRSIYRNPFIDFSKFQPHDKSRKLKIWICSECLCENDLLCCFQCTTCFTPYEPSKADVMDHRTNDPMKMGVDSPEDASSFIRGMYPFHRLDLDAMSDLVSRCLREWELLSFPKELVSMVAEYVLPFFEFENQTDCRGDIDVADRTICRRTDQFIADGTWRNCFGSIAVGYNHFVRKFQWKLRCEGRGAAMIGFVQKEGASRCMGHHFAFYDDGYGVAIRSSNEEIIVELHWFKMRTDLKCEFLLNGERAFELPPHKQYKFAVALEDLVEVTCVEYEEYE